MLTMGISSSPGGNEKDKEGEGKGKRKDEVRDGEEKGQEWIG